MRTPATLYVQTSNGTRSFSQPAGVSYVSVPMAQGAPSFALVRSGRIIAGATSSMAISMTNCTSGFYQYNTFAGSVHVGTVSFNTAVKNAIVKTVKS